MCGRVGADPEGLRSLCFGYLAGSWDQLLMTESGRSTRTICAPTGLNLDDLRTGLLFYLEQWPAERDTAAAVVVERAAVAAFPC